MAPVLATGSPWQVTVTLCGPAAAPAGTANEALSVQSALDTAPEATAVASHRTRAAAPHWKPVPRTCTVLPGVPDPGSSETAGGGRTGGGGGSGASTRKVPLRLTEGREAQVATTVCVPGAAFAGTTYRYVKAPDASVHPLTGGKRSLVRVSGPANPSPFPAQSKPLPFTWRGPFWLAVGYTSNTGFADGRGRGVVADGFGFPPCVGVGDVGPASGVEGPGPGVDPAGAEPTAAAVAAVVTMRSGAAGPGTPMMAGSTAAVHTATHEPRFHSLFSIGCAPLDPHGPPRTVPPPGYES